MAIPGISASMAQRNKEVENFNEDWKGKVGYESPRKTGKTPEVPEVRPPDGMETNHPHETQRMY